MGQSWSYATLKNEISNLYSLTLSYFGTFNQQIRIRNWKNRWWSEIRYAFEIHAFIQRGSGNPAWQEKCYEKWMGQFSISQRPGPRATAIFPVLYI